MDISVRRLESLIKSTLTGQALLAGRVVLPVSQRTDAGIEGEVSLYIDSNDDLVLQAWNHVSKTWQETTLS